MIQTLCRDCGAACMASRINADPVCDDCRIRRAVEGAPGECNYCDEVPVAFVAHGADPLYLCRGHSEDEGASEVRYFRDFGTSKTGGDAGGA